MASGRPVAPATAHKNAPAPRQGSAGCRTWVPAAGQRRPLFRMPSQILRPVRCAARRCRQSPAPAPPPLPPPPPRPLAIGALQIGIGAGAAEHADGLNAGGCDPLHQPASMSVSTTPAESAGVSGKAERPAKGDMEAAFRLRRTIFTRGRGRESHHGMESPPVPECLSARRDDAARVASFIRK